MLMGLIQGLANYVDHVATAYRDRHKSKLYVELEVFLSLGVPILNMGDECGQSSGGSLAYSDRMPFDWNALRAEFGIQTLQFISFLSSLRKRRRDLLQRRNFLKEDTIEWHGSNQSSPNWDDTESKFLAMTLKPSAEVDEFGHGPNLFGELHAAFNAGEQSENSVLLHLQHIWYGFVWLTQPFLFQVFSLQMVLELRMDLSNMRYSLIVVCYSKLGGTHDPQMALVWHIRCALPPSFLILVL